MDEDQQSGNDTVGVTVADYGDISLKTDFLRAHVDGHSVGIRTLEWPDQVVLVADTDDGDNRVTIGQVMSPEKAREVADTLYEAADGAEQLHQEAVEYDPKEGESLLRKLLP